MRATVFNVPCRSKAAKVLWTEEEEMEVTRLAEQYELDGPQEGTSRLLWSLYADVNLMV